MHKCQKYIYIYCFRDTGNESLAEVNGSATKYGVNSACTWISGLGIRETEGTPFHGAMEIYCVAQGCNDVQAMEGAKRWM